MDVRDHNREAWNRQVEKGNPWTRPVGESEVEAARGGEWRISGQEKQMRQTSFATLLVGLFLWSCISPLTIAGEEPRTGPLSVSAQVGSTPTPAPGVTPDFIPTPTPFEDFVRLPHALGLSGVPVFTGGDAPWTDDPVGGTHGDAGARGGSIGPGQESWMEITLPGPAALYFLWRMSAEADSSREKLLCAANGANAVHAEPDDEWRSSWVALPDAANTVRWTYKKEGTAVGTTADAWVDLVALLPDPSPTPSPSPRPSDTPFPTLESTGTPFPTLTPVPTFHADFCRHLVSNTPDEVNVAPGEVFHIRTHLQCWTDFWPPEPIECEGSVYEEIGIFVYDYDPSILNSLNRIPRDYPPDIYGFEALTTGTTTIDMRGLNGLCNHWLMIPVTVSGSPVPTPTPLPTPAPTPLAVHSTGLKVH